MKELSEVDIKNIKERIIKLGEYLYGNLPYNMPPLQVLLSFLILRRIDCLIGKYAKQSMEFYLKNRDRYSDERMLSEMQSRFGGYPFYNFSGLNIDSILLSDKSIDVVINNYIQGFSNNVQEILEGLLLRNSIAILQRQSKFLEIVLRTFQEIDLSMNSVDDEEFVELTYSLIERMGGSSYRGGYMTPLPLAKLMTEILFQQIILGKSSDDVISIYDPVCGTGNLLSLAYNKAISHYFHHHLISLCGQDIDYHSSSIAKAMVLLLGNEFSAICHGDTLINDFFLDRKFDYILADMPLRQSWKHIKDIVVGDSRFFAGLPGYHDSQFLFIEHMVSKMTQCSRVVFVTSGSILYSGTVSSGESRIRKWLFENDLVDCIVSLPRGVHMPSTLIPLYLWVLTNNKEEQHKGKTLLINVRDTEGGSVRKPSLDDKTIQEILDRYKDYSNTENSQVISNDKFGYYEIAYTEEGYKKQKKVSFSLNTKVEDYFNINIIPYAKGKVTIDYLSVEKGYSIDFNKVFAQKEQTISPADISSKRITPLLKSLSSFQKDIDALLEMELKSEEDINNNTAGWSEYPLNYFANMINGAAKPKNQNSHGLPYLSITNLRDVNAFEEKYEWNPSDIRIATEKDILLVSKGFNAGEVFRGVNGIASNSLVIIRPQNEVVIPSYLYYLLKGYENHLRSLSAGAGVKSLDTKTINVIKFKLPPIKIQENIVSCLDEIDKKVEFVNQVIGNSDNVFSEYRQALIEAAVRGKLKIS